MPMQRLKIVIAGLLVICWWPTTSLCLVERAGWVKIGGCCDEPSPNDQSPCCALASASYKYDDNGQSIASPSLAAHVESSHPVNVASEAPIISYFDSVSPPELCHTWQFCTRTAANPRAPSLVS
jgi:hypothetical protein